MKQQEIITLHDKRKNLQKQLGFALSMGDGIAVTSLMKACSSIEIRINKLKR